jgi:hypothetical protein
VELTLNTSISSEFINQNFPTIRPGDQLTFKVIRRIEPFRYIVKFAGKQIEVNSSVSLYPNDFILVQLQKTAPRTVFTFLDKISENFIQNNSHYLAESLHLGNHPLATTFVQWSLKLGLPIRESEFKSLKRFYKLNSQSKHSLQIFLLNYFWGKLNFPEDFFDDPLYILRFLYEENLIEDQKKQLIKLKSEIPSQNDFVGILDLLNSFSQNLYAPDSSNVFTILKNKILSVSHFFLSEEFESMVTKDENTKKLISDYFTQLSPSLWDLVKFLYQQQKRTKENQWIVFPIGNKDFQKNFYTYFRQIKLGEKLENEFLFAFPSDNFGDVVVNGKIRETDLFIIIFSSHKGLQELTDKYNVILQERIQKINLNLQKMEFISGKDLLNSAGNILLCSKESKFEVLI